MKITDILVRDAVILELASDTKNEVLMEMIHALAERSKTCTERSKTRTASSR